MSKHAVAPLILALIVVTTGHSAVPFYWGGGKQIPLLVDSTRVIVKFESGLSPGERAAIIQSIGRLGPELADSNLIDGFSAFSLMESTGLDEFISIIRQTSGLSQAEPYYLTKDRQPHLVGNRFCVGFRPEVTKAQIDSVNIALGVELVYEIEGMPNVWILHNMRTSQLGSLEVANLYYKSSLCEFAHPIFSARPVPFTVYKLYDHYNFRQDHIKRVIGSFNNRSVWDFAGLTESVTVAIIDSKIYSHEDLPATRILPGKYYVTETSKLVAYHGMCCAGLIGASHTTDSVSGLNSTSGMISMNPRCRILPVTIFNDSMRLPLADTVAAAITWAYQHGADIISCSWGYRNSNVYYDVIANAISLAHHRGRVRGSDTLGCSIFFSSGNYALDTANYGRVAFPAHLDSCIAVGAVHVDNDSDRWYYSQYGYKLDLVAPSGIPSQNDGVFTLDVMGSQGANPGYWGGGTLSACQIWPEDSNYYCQFSGTSAACPIAAGVASLLLSKDPTLRADGQWPVDRNFVKNILEESAAYTGYDPDNERGHGRVDAFRAVLSISHGDASNDGVIDFSDFYAIVDYLTSNIEPFPSVLLADCNCDGIVDSSDMYYIIDYLYFGGFPPVKPCFVF